MNTVSITTALRSALLIAVCGMATPAIAQYAHAARGPGGGAGAERGMVFDGRYHHDHYYPPRGYAVPVLPRGYNSVAYGHDRYFVRGGVWYRPYGPRFVVIAPPLGVVIPFLPDFYTTVWFGGVPYYYANDAYYLWSREARGYVVTQPPSSDTEATTQARVSSDDFFVYPRNGQSADDQSRDRFECHQWAVSQTGFDPSEPGGGVAESQNNAKRSDYRRAISACLEARQYTVK